MINAILIRRFAGGLEAYSNWLQVSLPAEHDGGRKMRGFVLFHPQLSSGPERGVNQENKHIEADVFSFDFCAYIFNTRSLGAPPGPNF